MELKNNSVELTEEGIALAEMALETNDLWDENDPWARWIFVSFNYLLKFLFTCSEIPMDAWEKVGQN